MLHFRGGRAGISKEAYPELDPAFYDDVAKAYGDELRSLAAAGCTYVQMDDTNLAYLCDEKMREAARQRGDDPNELPHRYAKFINKVVAQKPAGHDAGDAPVPRQLQEHARGGRATTSRWPRRCSSEMNLDAYFLEYDDDALGRLPPAALPAEGQDRGARAWSPPSSAQLEDKDDLKRRIDEAAKYAPLEQLALSPQCGFSSTVHGNNIAVEAQRRKLDSWWRPRAKCGTEAIGGHDVRTPRADRNHRRGAQAHAQPARRAQQLHLGDAPRAARGARRGGRRCQRALPRHHGCRAWVLCRAGPQRSRGRHRRRPGGRAHLQAAGAAHRVDAGAGDRDGQRCGRRRRRELRPGLRPRDRCQVGELHPGVRQDRPDPRLRRHLVAAASGGPREGDRPGADGRQAAGRDCRAHGLDLGRGRRRRAARPDDGAGAAPGRDAGEGAGRHAAHDRRSRS